MKKLKDLYQENKKSFFRYCLVGLIGTGLLLLMAEVLHVNYLISYFASGAVGFVARYIIEKYWVFKEK